MTNTNDKVGSQVGNSILERAKFGPGMLLKHGDLEQLNIYTRDLSRLMFKSFFGCGVVCGLIVSAKPECEKLSVTVTSGLALACSGDPVYVPPTNQPFLTNETVTSTDGPFWVVLCGTTKCCAPRVATCSSDEDEAMSACTREKDAYEIRVLRNQPECGCGLLKTVPPTEIVWTEIASGAEPARKIDCKCADSSLPYYVKHYDGICECDCGKCSGCDCDCVILARLDWSNQENAWKADHSVRRFIRPVLMRDPQVEKERQVPVAGGNGNGDQPPAAAPKPTTRAARPRGRKDNKS